MSPGTRQAIFFAVLLAVPLASYFFVFKPQNEQINRARQEIEHKEAMLEKLREATSQTTDLARANDEISASIEAIKQRLPTTQEMDNVLRQVSELAAENGLKIPNFRRSNQALPAGMAMEQPLDVEITGDFDGFYQFLLALERLPRIMRIPTMQISRSDRQDGEMMSKFVLTIYYQGEE